MSRPRGSTNNVKAGIFVVVTILIAFSVVVTLSGVRDRIKPRDSYIVRFDIGVGAGGLEPGSSVLVGGRPVGRVAKIELRTESVSDALPPGIDVTILVDKNIRFYGAPGAAPTGYIERPLLGSGGEVNFTSVGDPSRHPRLPVGSVLPGTLAPPSFLAQAGYGDEQAQQLRNILRRADEITENVNATVSDVRGRSSKWLDDVDHMMTRGREFADDLPRLASEARERLDQLEDIFNKARAVIDDNRDKIDAIVDNTKEATEHGRDLLANLNEETRGLLNDMLREGREAAASSREAVERLDTLLIEQTPTIRRAFANARLASDQLKLTLAEVRRAPWRLLYRPDTHELEFELLYDAARTYAVAASDLRAASESLQSITGATDGAAVEDALDALRRSFNVYREAERRFLDMVIERER